MLLICKLKSIFKSRIHKIRDQESNTFFLNYIGYISQHFADIRFPVLRFELNQFTDDSKDMRLPFLRRNELLNLIAEKNYPDFIIILNSRERKNSTQFGNHILLKLCLCSKIFRSAN